MTVAKRRSSTDDKVEAKRKIIRRSLDDITAEVEIELQHENLHSHVSLVVPSRYSLVTIGGQLGSEEWSRTLEIVRRVLGKWLGGNELRGRPLARSVATALMDADDPKVADQDGVNGDPLFRGDGSRSATGCEPERIVQGVEAAGQGDAEMAAD